MPPGRREMSLRSSASSALAEIFVATAIWRSVIPRRSRASLGLAPKSPEVRSGVILGGKPVQLGGNPLDNVRKPYLACQTARAPWRPPDQAVRYGNPPLSPCP